MAHRFRMSSGRVALLLFATALLVGAGMVQTFGTVRAQTNQQTVGTIQVTDVTLELVEGQDDWIKSIVTFSQSVPTADVSLTVTFPGDRTTTVTRTSWFSDQLVFGIQFVSDGVYTVRVDDVQTDGLQFDANGSQTLEASLTVGNTNPDDGSGSSPEPGDNASDNGTNSWHEPTDHEHGDAPPQWATDWSMEQFGHGVIYGGDEGTPHENMHKHAAFKGFSTSMDGADLYFRVHAQSNPHGRSAQFHSYEVYARDSAGNISFWQGWVNCGNPETARFPRSQGDPGTRPAMLVVDQAAWDAGIRFEQWYCIGGAGWTWDIGWTIGDTTTIYHKGEQNTDVNDQSTWDKTGSFGLNRRIEAAWYGADSQASPNRGNPPKDTWFCATPKGQITNRDAGGPNACPGSTLPQYIASTMQSVEFPDNAVQKQFPGSPNLVLPN